MLFLSMITAAFFTVNYSAIVNMSPAQAAVQFDDVDARYAWAKDAIGQLTAKNVLSGMEENKFEPGRTVSREQLAKMIALAFELDVSKQSAQSFVDVPSDAWAFPYVEAVKDSMPRDPMLPINEFNPGGECTREVVAAAVAKAAGMEEATDTSSLASQFLDAADISPQLQSIVASAVELKLLQGDGGSLRPTAAVTRAEAAVFICRGLNFRTNKANAGKNMSTPTMAQTPSATQTAIVGSAQATVEQAKKWAQGRGAHQRYIDVADIYWKYGAQTGIRPEVLYAQAAKETNFGKYTGRVQPEQNNWAGIKTIDATGDLPEDHESFATPDDGVRAHFNHMAAYVGIAPAGEPHARYNKVKTINWAGSVKYVEELGGKWAPEPTYGQDLLNNYLTPLLETK